MDKVMEKIAVDIEKELEKKKALEEKLKACNDRIRSLENKKLEAENAQMVSSIRALNISPEELGALLSSIKQGKPVTEPVKAPQKEELEEKAV